METNTKPKRGLRIFKTTVCFVGTFFFLSFFVFFSPFIRAWLLSKEVRVAEVNEHNSLGRSNSRQTTARSVLRWGEQGGLGGLGGGDI